MLRDERATGTRRTSGARIGNPAEPPRHGVFPSNAYTPAIMNARTTATARALEAIGRLLTQPGRQALTRAEVRALGVADGACDRALRRLRAEGRIRRYGSGIYGVGGAKVFQAAPEALESLGYRIVPPERPDNWSARPNGTLIRLDRPCRRRILGHGVQMKFETPGGRRTRPRKVSMRAMDAFPAQREIEAHFESFHYCHSLGRAEKDLCVTKALEALESFRAPGASLVLDGATCLSRYCGFLRRFSDTIRSSEPRPDRPVAGRAPHSAHASDNTVIDSAGEPRLHFAARRDAAWTWRRRPDDAYRRPPDRSERRAASPPPGASAGRARANPLPGPRRPGPDPGPARLPADPPPPPRPRHLRRPVRVLGRRDRDRMGGAKSPPPSLTCFAISRWHPIASSVTIHPDNSSLSNSSGTAVISFDFSSVFTCPSTTPLPHAHALAICNAFTPRLRSWAGQPHIKSLSHQYVISEAIVQCRPDTLLSDADLRWLTLQKIKRHMSNHSHIMRRIASTNPTLPDCCINRKIRYCPDQSGSRLRESPSFPRKRESTSITKVSGFPLSRE